MKQLPLKCDTGNWLTSEDVSPAALDGCLPGSKKL